MAAIATPYLISIQPENGAAAAIGFSVRLQQIVGILAGALPVLLPAVWYLLRGEGARRRSGGFSASGVFAIWAAVVLVVAFFIDLPTNSEILFSFPLHIALSALAAGALDRWIVRGTSRVARAAVVYVLLCTIPLNTVFFTSAFLDDSRFVITRSESSLYDWISKFSRKEAIFLEAEDNVRVPVLAARDLYWGAENYARRWGYSESELNARRALRDAVFGTGEIPDELFRHAARLDRPLYVILRDVHADAGRQFQRISRHPRLTGKFMNDSIVVFEVNLKGL
jgi:hypothetical protein